MKRNKLITLTAVLMILTMTALFLFACASNDEPTPTPTPEEKPVVTASQVKSEIKTAISKSIVADVTKPVGFEYSIEVPSGSFIYKFNLKGYLDKNDVTASRVYVDLSKGKTPLFTLSADDEYLFFTSEGENRRFTGFDLAGVMTNNTIPDSDEFGSSMFGAIPGMVIDMIFGGKEFEQEIKGDVKVNTIYGDLKTIGGLLGGIVGGIVPALGDTVTNLLSSIKTEMSATINADGKIGKTEVELTIPDSDNVRVIFDKKLGNFNPNIVTPAKDDNNFIESKILNFSIDGKVNMTKKNGYIENTVTTYDYQLYVNMDLFAMLRNAIKVETTLDEYEEEVTNITFDATKLFDLEDSSFYFNLSHNCVDADKDDPSTFTCSCNKMEKANGSILTLAYSPASFGSNDFFVSVRPLALLPNGFFEDVLNLDGFLAGIIKSAVAGTIGTNINPASLFVTEPVETTTMSAETYAANLPNINVIKIVEKALDVLSEIKLTYEEGLRVGIGEVVDLLRELAPVIDTGSVDLPLAVQSFFGDADFMYVDVENATFGNPKLDTLDYYEMFMIIDKNVGEYKFDDKRQGPAVEVKPILDNNGNIVVNSEVVKNYNVVDGKYVALPMSSIEYALMMENAMAIPYTYTTVTGYEGSGAVQVQAAYGFDKDKLGKQTLTLVTSVTDGANTGTLGALAPILAMIGVEIPGNVFTTTIDVLANPTKGVFSQSGDNAIDPSKTYNFDDKLNVKMNLTLTYGEGESAITKVIEGIAPVKGGELISGGAIKAIDSFDLEYDMLGFTKTINVKMNKPTLDKPVQNEKPVAIEVGNEYAKFNTAIKFKVSGAKRDTSLNIVKTYNTTFETPEGVEVYINADGKFAVKFEKAGNYTITMNVNGGFTKVYTFNVSEKAPVVEKVELPKFSAGITGKQGAFKVTMGRVNQLGDLDKIMTTIKVEGKSLDEEPIVSTLAYGTDFVIKMNGEELKSADVELLAFQGRPQRFEIVLKSETIDKDNIKITFLAKDFDNEIIGESKTAKF